MKNKRLILLGSTGSIGVQTLDVAEKHGFPVVALAANRNVERLEEQIRKFRPAVAVMYDETAAATLKIKVGDCPVKVLSGMDGLCEAASLADADIVVNAVVGMVGLRPTMTAIAAGHTLALANKETLVAGGDLVMRAAREQGVRILPVDSEHSAIFQCLQGGQNGPWTPPFATPPQVKRLILTASGGPFFGKTAEDMTRVTLADALKHPNWSMGQKITIDSATMMNKGLELIEARWLFDMPEDRIDVVVHRESVVHSLIEYDDGSTIAQMGVPDMRIPIQFALTWPQRIPSPVPSLQLAEWGKLTFFSPDDEAFPCMNLCREALRRGGASPAAVNSANEEANALFRNGKISFTAIAEAAAAALDHSYADVSSVEDILAVDQTVRARTRAFLNGR